MIFFVTFSTWNRMNLSRFNVICCLKTPAYVQMWVFVLKRPLAGRIYVRFIISNECVCSIHAFQKKMNVVTEFKIYLTRASEPTAVAWHFLFFLLFTLLRLRYQKKFTWHLQSRYVLFLLNRHLSRKRAL